MVVAYDMRMRRLCRNRLDLRRKAWMRCLEQADSRAIKNSGPGTELLNAGPHVGKHLPVRDDDGGPLFEALQLS